MSLETFRIDGLDRALRATDPSRWWEAIERHASRAMIPVARAMANAAPKGKSGKLGRGFDVRTQRIRQGLIQGVQVDIGARVPYGHLVERGHKIVPRGRGSKVVTRHRLLGGFVITEQVRQRSRGGASLKTRRAGASGFVPGRFFGERTFRSQADQVVGLLSRLLEQDFGH